MGTRVGGSSEKMGSMGAQPERPRSMASLRQVCQPRRRKYCSQPGLPSGVDSKAAPVMPPPCHSRRGQRPRSSWGTKYWTYICSAWYWPLGSMVMRRPERLLTSISFTGWSRISSVRPPTKKEPMSRSARGL